MIGPVCWKARLFSVFVSVFTKVTPYSPWTVLGQYSKKNSTKVLISMQVKDLKWYSPFVDLVGAILSFADPITDILTLVEFYRTDHKI